jgi:hypothetical protein
LLTLTSAFIDKWIPQINEAHAAANGGDVVMGGIEDNVEIIHRISALTDAWDNMQPWTNPMPNSW